MLTEKDYCDYETCVALMDLGYDDSTDLRYNSYGSLGDFLGGIKAPSLYEAQKWLREEKRICVEVDCCAGGYTWELCKAYQGDWFSGGTTIYTHYCEDNYNNALLNDCGKYDSYEEALSKGIKEAVKILKEK